MDLPVIDAETLCSRIPRARGILETLRIVWNPAEKVQTLEQIADVVTKAGLQTAPASGKLWKIYVSTCDFMPGWRHALPSHVTYPQLKLSLPAASSIEVQLNGAVMCPPAVLQHINMPSSKHQRHDASCSWQSYDALLIGDKYSTLSG